MNQGPNVSLSQESVLRFNQRMYEKIEEEHELEKSYLRPIEITLMNFDRTLKIFKNDKPPSQAKRTPLAQGIMIAAKKIITDNTYDAIQLEPAIFQRSQNEKSFRKHRKNLLNLLKQVNIEQKKSNISHINQESERQRPHSSMKYEEQEAPSRTIIQIAICVCIYSEDASMLKQTLETIKQNVISLVKSGVRQDSIGIFVMFDGITKLHPSVLQYITYLENRVVDKFTQLNDIKAKQDYNRTSPLIRNYQQSGYEEEQIEKFFNRYLPRIVYSEEELQDRQDRCLQSVYNSYIQITQLKETIQKLKANPNVTYSMLPPKVQQQFEDLAKYQRKDELISIEKILFDLTVNEKEAMKALCLKAITQTESFCNTYIASRNDLAYLSMHRETIYSKENKRIKRDESAASSSSQNERCIQIVFRDRQSQQSTQERMRMRSQLLQQIHLNLFFCVKYKNEGKLSSHNWFFNGFCKELNPKYVILMDVGLKAKDNSIFAMYQHLKLNPKLGGVCGYMSIKIERSEVEDEAESEEVDWLTNIAHFIVDIQRAQQVEYHFAHLLDKPFQSLFKFIHVLPGAFSGYNMEAIHSPNDKKELVFRKYFESLNKKVVDNHIVETELTMWWMALKVLLPDFLNTLFLTVDPNSEEQLLCNENMNMAEDRILCFGIHKNGFDLAYLPDAYSEVDPIKSLHAMYGQRRRWINGSFFAFEKVKADLAQYSEQIKSCEFFLKLQMLYLSLVNAVSYFSVSLFFFTVHISMDAFKIDVLIPLIDKQALPPNVTSYFLNTMDYLYTFFVIAMIYCSLNLSYHNKRFKRFIYLSSTILGCFSVSVMVVLLVDLSKGFCKQTKSLFVHQKQNIQSQDFLNLSCALNYIVLAMFGLHALPAVLHAIFYRKFHIIVQLTFGVASFLFYNPTYLINLSIYALCRMDDISWGTKGNNEDQAGQSRLKQKWRKIKFVHVFKFIMWNIILSFTFLTIQTDELDRLLLITVIMGVVTFILVTKVLLGLMYSLAYKACLKSRHIKFNVGNFNFTSEISNRILSLRETEISPENIAANIQSLIKLQPPIQAQIMQQQ